jgi:hypothetical protein
MCNFFNNFRFNWNFYLLFHFYFPLYLFRNICGIIFNIFFYRYRFIIAAKNFSFEDFYSFIFFLNWLFLLFNRLRFINIRIFYVLFNWNSFLYFIFLLFFDVWDTWLIFAGFFNCWLMSNFCIISNSSLSIIFDSNWTIKFLFFRYFFIDFNRIYNLFFRIFYFFLFIIFLFNLYLF